LSMDQQIVNGSAPSVPRAISSLYMHQCLFLPILCTYIRAY